MSTEDQAPQSTSRFRLTEYVPALLAVLLALLLASWYVLQWLRRSPEPPPEPAPGLKLKPPGELQPGSG